jgi:hypothetical protein
MHAQSAEIKSGAFEGKVARWQWTQLSGLTAITCGLHPPFSRTRQDDCGHGSDTPVPPHPTGRVAVALSCAFPRPRSPATGESGWDKQLRAKGN